MNAAIILSGGTGSRFGGSTPKQYLYVNGKEVISYSVDALRQSGVVDRIVVCAAKEYCDRLRKDYKVETTEGGATRNASLKNALDYIAASGGCDNIIILEAARPMLSADIVRFYFEKLGEYHAVITGQRIVDSLGCFALHSVCRSDYYLIQAPEAFDFALLYASFRADSTVTATNQQLPEGTSLYINFDFTDNLKITYKSDLGYCEARLKEKNDRTDK